MNYLSLYKLIKKFGEEAQKDVIFLDPNIADPVHIDNENLLKKYNIKPIQAGASSWLGSGEKSSVYKVSYNGQPMVAKITQYFGDMDKMQKLYQLGQYIGELKRHIPIIYDIFIHESDLSVPKYIILVEELWPLEERLKKIINAENPPQILKFLLTPEMAKELVENVLKISKLEVSEEKLIINDLTDLIIHLVKPLSDEKFFSKFKEQNNDKAFQDLAWNIGKLFVKGIKNIFNKKINHTINNDIFEKVQNVVSRFFFRLFTSKIKFPISHNNYNKKHVLEYGFSIYEKLPETKSLMHLLKTLQNFGINWQDMQHFNLMQRPSTGDVVISDPGNFELI